MTSKEQLSRRSFVKAAAASALLPSALTRGFASESSSKTRKGQKMKVGSVSWNFRGIGAGPPMDEPIEIIGEMGFDGIELIVSRPEDLDTYWKEPVLSRLRKKLDKYHLEVSQFVLFQYAVEGLSSLDDDERNRSLGVFERGCKIGAALNAPIINIVAPWARELKGPREYLPRYYAVTKGEPEVKYHIDIPKGFDFNAVWEKFVETIRTATAMAKANGLRFSLENHTHTLAPDSMAFRLLWDRIKDPALGMNLDIGWIQLQREYPPLAIYQAADHLINVHIRDIDGVGLRFVGIGEGVMDYPGVMKALKDIGYSGYLTIEQDGVPDMKGVVTHGRDMLRRLIG
ncbi:sugar phosphate isomerase/epimerase [bacterium]|nr:sugar phosphate isomerase/epimerase [bacterium]